jgi:hypothetical protein
MPAVVSVVEVFPLTLLALAVLVSSEGIVGVTIQTYHLSPLKEILSKISVQYSGLLIDTKCLHNLTSILTTIPLFKNSNVWYIIGFKILAKRGDRFIIYHAEEW